MANMKFDTKSIHLGYRPFDNVTGNPDVVQPIHLTSTYARKEVEKLDGLFDYCRSGNPNRYALEKTIAGLLNVEHCIMAPSGMAAVDMACYLLHPGDAILSQKGIYSGTTRYFDEILSKKGISVKYASATDPGEFIDSAPKNAKIVWFESPTNPLLDIADIAEIAKRARKRGLISVCDNTFLSPYLQNTLELGCDIEVHSATKYLGGHSDLIGGCVATANSAYATEFKFFQNAVGISTSPFNDWLMARGIKTLSIRMEKHCDNAEKISKFLSGRKEISKVYYPGLKNHPNHLLSKKQSKRHGAIVSFEMKGEYNAAKKVCESTRLFLLAESLGGVESLIDHVITMTHSSIPKERQKEFGLTPGLIRLSVGIENVEDLIADLEQALNKV